MGWLSSLFSSSDYSRKGQTLSSTHEAFSIPTSSPTFPHPNVFTPTTPDLDPATPNYTYPPQGPAAYSYFPASAGLNSQPNSASLLPVHHPPGRALLSSKSSYPPLSNTWHRIRTWLDREYPELGDTLNYGLLAQDLTHLELQFGFALPPVLRESYLCVDGQEPESAAGCSQGLFFGLKFLSLEDALEEWRFWREVDEDLTTGGNPQLRQAMQSIPPGWVRKDYSNRGWIPLIADKAGNYVGVDLNPDDRGTAGQVIVFGRDFDTKVVLWRGDGLAGWARWLANFADELESGDGIEIGHNTEASDDSEDDVGYESYFYDGTGRGQGDGGGYTGSGGGLHLTGEYRGWNILEAWADRSLRKWYEAGVISDRSLLPRSEEGLVTAMDSEKESDAGTFLLPNDSDEGSTPLAGAALPKHGGVPTISVTRAPAPKPVDLPLPDDILSVSESPRSSSFDHDLESGRSPGLHEAFADRASLISTSVRTKSRPALVNADSENAQLPTYLTNAVIAHSHSASSGSMARQSTDAGSVPDLLADSLPVMPTKPIFPSSPTVPSELLEQPADTQIIAAPAEVLHFPLDPEPESTIRLVGVGMVSQCPSVTQEPEILVSREDSDASRTANSLP